MPSPGSGTLTPTGLDDSQHHDIHPTQHAVVQRCHYLHNFPWPWALGIGKFSTKDICTWPPNQAWKRFAPRFHLAPPAFNVFCAEASAHAPSRRAMFPNSRLQKFEPGRPRHIDSCGRMIKDPILRIESPPRDEEGTWGRPSNQKQKSRHHSVTLLVNMVLPCLDQCNKTTLPSPKSV